VTDTGPERQTGRKAQSANIMAAKVSIKLRYRDLTTELTLASNRR
jgi:hypothetical protein